MERPGRGGARPRPAAGHRPRTVRPVPIPGLTQPLRAILETADDLPRTRAAALDPKRRRHRPAAKTSKTLASQPCAHRAAGRQYGSHYQRHMRACFRPPGLVRWAVRSQTRPPRVGWASAGNNARHRASRCRPSPYAPEIAEGCVTRRPVGRLPASERQRWASGSRLRNDGSASLRVSPGSDFADLPAEGHPRERFGVRIGWTGGRHRPRGSRGE